MPSTLGDDEPGVKVLGKWTVEEYGSRIAPRLMMIAREESEPKVLPLVMAAWGIDPDGVQQTGESRQARWTMDDILQVRDLVVPHIAGLWAASGKEEIESEWKAIHDIMDPHDLKWMVDAVEQYEDAPSFVAWVPDPDIPLFPPVTFNVTLNLERNDDGYLMRWDIACVRTDEPESWVTIYRVVANAADAGGKAILRHLARTDVLLFSLMSGKDRLEIHANRRGDALVPALCFPVWRGLFPVEWPQEQRERCQWSH